MEALQKVLNDIGIRATVVDISHGPVVDRYEIEMAHGERVDKIFRLEKHLSYHYGSTVRISLIPGVSRVGIEVSKAPETVSLKSVMPADRLSIAIGRSLDGPITASLSSLPHMIVAGATGSGKSVYINSVITELLAKNTPDDLRLLLIDPKQVELAQYNGIPHLLTPVINNPRHADRALQGIIREMVYRYERMKSAGMRHVAGLDLPVIVVVIDELSDLMIVTGKSVEASITRIAQLARAAGIHLILATQRPSVDVLTGLIKSNLPARLAFRTASTVDSRVILDQRGAENLVGRGDALYRTAGGDLIRVQAPYVSDTEIGRLVDHWQGRGTSASRDIGLLNKVLLGLAGL